MQARMIDYDSVWLWDTHGYYKISAQNKAYGYIDSDISSVSGTAYTDRVDN